MDAKTLIAELCRDFYRLGWVSGTGGGVSVRQGDRIFMAPSGVQKERMAAEDMFELDDAGAVLSPPEHGKLSECAPLFMNAYRMRNAGAVLHSHSVHAVMATLLFEDTFEATHLEMLKGLRGHGYRDRLVVPIIENTPREAELSDSMAKAMADFPDVDAVLVRRHGVYVWGESWQQAKTQAECYDYLFALAVEMRRCGIDPSASPADSPRRAGFAAGGTQ